MTRFCVMDISMGSIEYFVFVGNPPDDFEDWLDENSKHRSNDCNWMEVTETSLEITVVNEQGFIIK